MDIQSWAQLGGTAAIAALAIWKLSDLVVRQNKTINNHLDHATAAQKEEARAKVLQAKAIQRLSDVIDKKIK